MFEVSRVMSACSGRLILSVSNLALPAPTPAFNSERWWRGASVGYPRSAEAAGCALGVWLSPPPTPLSQFCERGGRRSVRSKSDVGGAGRLCIESSSSASTSRHPTFSSHLFHLLILPSPLILHHTSVSSPYSESEPHTSIDADAIICPSDCDAERILRFDDGVEQSPSPRWMPYL